MVGKPRVYDLTVRYGHESPSSIMSSRHGAKHCYCKYKHIA